MRNKIQVLFISSLVFLFTTGCTIITSGKGSWEIYAGVRTTQEGDEPAKVQIESKIADSLLDGKITEGE